MVFMFAGAFSYYTDDEAEGGQLEKVSYVSHIYFSPSIAQLFVYYSNEIMDEYINRQPPWTIERGSVLCPWNIDYFFLKFKDPQTAQIRMHWSLPSSMAAHLTELREAAETPESAAGETISTMSTIGD